MRSIAAAKVLLPAPEYPILVQLRQLPSSARRCDSVCRVACVAAKNRCATVCEKFYDRSVEARPLCATKCAPARNRLRASEEIRLLEQCANIPRSAGAGPGA